MFFLPWEKKTAWSLKSTISLKPFQAPATVSGGPMFPRMRPADPATLPFRAAKQQLSGLEQVAWPLGPQFPLCDVVLMVHTSGGHKRCERLTDPSQSRQPAALSVTVLSPLPPSSSSAGTRPGRPPGQSWGLSGPEPQPGLHIRTWTRPE